MKGKDGQHRTIPRGKDGVMKAGAKAFRAIDFVDFDIYIDAEDSVDVKRCIPENTVRFLLKTR